MKIIIIVVVIIITLRCQSCPCYCVALLCIVMGDRQSGKTWSLGVRKKSRI